MADVKPPAPIRVECRYAMCTSGEKAELECLQCYLVGYCSEECAMKDRGQHSDFCKRHQSRMGVDYDPKKDLDRFLSVLDEKPYLRPGGRASARVPVSRVDHPKLIATDTPADFSLNSLDRTLGTRVDILAEGVGDLHLFIDSFLKLPPGKDRKFVFHIKEAHEITVLRNLVLLLMALNSTNFIRTAEAMVHYWYSAYLPPWVFHFLQCSVAHCLQEMKQSVHQPARKTGQDDIVAASYHRKDINNIVIATWLPKRVWTNSEHLKVFSSAFTPAEHARVQIQRYQNIQSRRQEIERELADPSKPPEWRTSRVNFLETGLLLPISTSRSSHTCPNPSFFIWGKQCCDHGDDPLRTHEQFELAGSFNSAKNDRHGQLFFHLRERLVRFICKWRSYQGNIEIRMFTDKGANEIQFGDPDLRWPPVATPSPISVASSWPTGTGQGEEEQLVLNETDSDTSSGLFVKDNVDSDMSPLPDGNESETAPLVGTKPTNAEPGKQKRRPAKAQKKKAALARRKTTNADAASKKAEQLPSPKQEVPTPNVNAEKPARPSSSRLESTETETAAGQRPRAAQNPISSRQEAIRGAIDVKVDDESKSPAECVQHTHLARAGSCTANCLPRKPANRQACTYILTGAHAIIFLNDNITPQGIGTALQPPTSSGMSDEPLNLPPLEDILSSSGDLFPVRHFLQYFDDCGSGQPSETTGDVPPPSTETPGSEPGTEKTALPEKQPCSDTPRKSSDATTEPEKSARGEGEHPLSLFVRRTGEPRCSGKADEGPLPLEGMTDAVDRAIARFERMWMDCVNAGSANYQTWFTAVEESNMIMRNEPGTTIDTWKQVTDPSAFEASMAECDVPIDSLWLWCKLLTAWNNYATIIINARRSLLPEARDNDASKKSPQASGTSKRKQRAKNKRGGKRSRKGKQAAHDSNPPDQASQVSETLAGVPTPEQANQASDTSDTLEQETEASDSFTKATKAEDTPKQETQPGASSQQSTKTDDALEQETRVRGTCNQTTKKEDTAKQHADNYSNPKKTTQSSRRDKKSTKASQGGKASESMSQKRKTVKQPTHTSKPVEQVSQGSDERGQESRQPRVFTKFKGKEVDITGRNIDPAIFEALPESFQEELVASLGTKPEAEQDWKMVQRKRAAGKGKGGDIPRQQEVEKRPTRDQEPLVQPEEAKGRGQDKRPRSGTRHMATKESKHNASRGAASDNPPQPPRVAAQNNPRKPQVAAASSNGPEPPRVANLRAPAWKQVAAWNNLRTAQEVAASSKAPEPPQETDPPATASEKSTKPPQVASSDKRPKSPPAAASDEPPEPPQIAATTSLPPLHAAISDKRAKSPPAPVSNKLPAPPQAAASEIPTKSPQAATPSNLPGPLQTVAPNDTPAWGSEGHNLVANTPSSDLLTLHHGSKQPQNPEQPELTVILENDESVGSQVDPLSDKSILSASEALLALQQGVMESGEPEGSKQPPVPSRADSVGVEGNTLPTRKLLEAFEELRLTQQRLGKLHGLERPGKSVELRSVKSQGSSGRTLPFNTPFISSKQAQSAHHGPEQARESGATSQCHIPDRSLSEFRHQPGKRLSLMHDPRRGQVVFEEYAPNGRVVVRVLENTSTRDSATPKGPDGIAEATTQTDAPMQTDTPTQTAPPALAEATMRTEATTQTEDLTQPDAPMPAEATIQTESEIQTESTTTDLQLAWNMALVLWHLQPAHSAVVPKKSWGHLGMTYALGTHLAFLKAYDWGGEMTTGTSAPIRTGAAIRPSYTFEDVLDYEKFHFVTRAEELGHGPVRPVPWTLGDWQEHMERIVENPGDLQERGHF